MLLRRIACFDNSSEFGAIDAFFSSLAIFSTNLDILTESVLTVSVSESTLESMVWMYFDSESDVDLVSSLIPLSISITPLSDGSWSDIFLIGTAHFLTIILLEDG